MKTHREIHYRVVKGICNMNVMETFELAEMAYILGLRDLSLSLINDAFDSCNPNQLHSWWLTAINTGLSCEFLVFVRDYYMTLLNELADTDGK